jgi:hypothetical protein
MSKWFEAALHTLEFLRRLRVIRILVRVEFNRHSPISLLDILFACILFHTKDFVVILPLALLKLKFSVSNLLLESRVRGVGVRSRL